MVKRAPSCLVNFKAAPRTSYETFGSVLPSSETWARNRMLCGIRVFDLRLQNPAPKGALMMCACGMPEACPDTNPEFVNYLPIHSAISCAICSGDRSLTTRV